MLNLAPATLNFPEAFPKVLSYLVGFLGQYIGPSAACESSPADGRIRVSISENGITLGSIVETGIMLIGTGPCALVALRLALTYAIASSLPSLAAKRCGLFLSLD